MNFIKNTLFTIFVLLPAMPLFIWLIWNDKLGEFCEVINKELKD